MLTKNIFGIIVIIMLKLQNIDYIIQIYMEKMLKNLLKRLLMIVCYNY